MAQMTQPMTIADALERLDSSTVKERMSAVNDLRHVLKHNRSGTHRETIADTSFHHLFESLFNLITGDRTQFAKATKSVPRATIAKRLDAFADALRLAVEYGRDRLTTKTVRSILDHIIQCLPTSDGGYCEPLMLPYLKCMQALLEYQPHVEHLPTQDWLNIVQFCTTCLQSLKDAESSDIPSANGTLSIRSRTASLDQAARSGTAEPSGRTSRASISASATQEFILCLRQLLLASNAPVAELATECLDILIAFLYSVKRAGRAHQDAFAAINSLLMRTSLDKPELTSDSVRQLIPVIRDLWSARTAASLKDEMLAFFIITQYHLQAVLQAASTNDHLHKDVESLVDTIRAEYARKSGQGQLLLEDIRMQPASDESDDCFLRMPAFSLSTQTTNSTQWVTFSCAGKLILLLDSVVSDPVVTDPPDEPPSKRMKRMSAMQNILRELQDPNATNKICALKILSVMLPHAEFSRDVFEEVCDRLITCVSDKNSMVVAWALMCLAASIFNKHGSSSTARSQWLTVWHLALRNITSAVTCRPACLAMQQLLQHQLLDFLDISDSIDTLFDSIDLGGPALVADSSVALLVAITSCITIQNPSRLSHACDRVIHWLFSRWSPGSPTHRVDALSSRSATANDILCLLATCSGQDIQPEVSGYGCLSGIIGHAASYVQCNRASAKYLLLADSGERPAPDSNRSMAPVLRVDSDKPLTFDSHTLQRLSAEIERSTQQFNEMATDRPSAISNSMLAELTTCCIVVCALARRSPEPSSEKSTQMHQMAADLAKSVTDFCAATDEDGTKFELLAACAASSFPPLRNMRTLQDDPFGAAGLSVLALHIIRAMESRKKTQASHSMQRDDFDDMMDVDSMGESQRTGDLETTQATSTPRSINATRSDNTAVRSFNSTYLRFIVSVNESVSNDQAINHIPGGFVDYLVNMDASSFIMSHNFLLSLLESPLQLRVEDAEAIFEYLGGEVLGSYEFDHSETGLCLCLGVMRHTLDIWTDNDNKNLYNDSADMYEWFVAKALDLENEKAGFASPQTRISASDLFRMLMAAKPKYAESLNLPSPRTSLLRLLRDSDIMVKFHIVEDLADIFEQFILTQHDIVFEDILQNLPTDEDWLAGLALRLSAIARLGSKWHTLLRNSVYYIFETAGICSSTEKHAIRCINRLVAALGLADAKSLFVMFAPQLLFTWLDSESESGAQHLDAIPFRIFGYSSLKSLLEDCLDEAFSQALMRGSKDDVSALTNAVKLSAKVALERTIARAVAYTISIDTENSSSKDKSKSAVNRERALSDMVGNDRYPNLVRSAFPKILGILFITLGDAHDAHRMKPPHSSSPATKYFEQVKNILDKIRSITYTDSDVDRESSLPPDQQPSFGSRSLFVRIERLCRRANYSIEKAWTSATYTFVMRMLLGQMKSALGSLHACSVIRKIRLLVCFAGPVALTGYPLQMTLHGLYPLLTDIQCAKEAIGLVEYLVKEGRDALADAFSFTAGVGLTLLMSVRAFLRSSQESTTQETVFKKTMSKASEFHTWFSSFLEQYVAERLEQRDSADRPSTADIETFKAIMQSAAISRAQGNSLKSTPEGLLLLELLRNDQRGMQGRQLLSPSSQHLAFTLLCQDFQCADYSGDDILGKDVEAQSYTRAVWRSSRQRGIREGYQLWAARVLGRAYASSGYVTLTAREIAKPSQSFTGKGGSLATASQHHIIRILADLFFSDDRSEAGFAESTLRLVHQQLSTAGKTDFAEIVQSHISQALALESSHEAEGFPTLAELNLNVVANPKTDDNFTVWVRDFVIALAQLGVEDAVLSAIPNIVEQVDGLAERLFPYVVHIVLHQHFDRRADVKKDLSNAFDTWTSRKWVDTDRPYLRMLVTALQYLRTQPLPREKTRNERDTWLDIDYLQVITAAERCGMHNLSLLLLESYTGQPAQPAQSSRRSSAFAPQIDIPRSLQLSIYKNLDEPDSFYGVQQLPGVPALLERLEYEGDGAKALLFRGARMDSSVRQHTDIAKDDARGLLRSVAMLNLNAVTQQLLGSSAVRSTGAEVTSSLLQTARKLEKWDVKAPDKPDSTESIIYKAFQGISNAMDVSHARTHVEAGLLQAFSALTEGANHSAGRDWPLRTLAVLSEADEVLSLPSSSSLGEVSDKLAKRRTWMRHGSVDDVKPILSARETLFSIIGQSEQLRTQLRSSPAESFKAEVEALRASAQVLRRQGSLQDALTSAIYLTDIAKRGEGIDIHVQGSAACELAGVLWDQSANDIAIQLLLQVRDSKELRRGMSASDSTQMFLMLARYTAEAQSEEPHEIIQNYLEPALKEIRALNNTGHVAGEVYHAHATFCDAQLRNVDVGELARLRSSIIQKDSEAAEYKALYKASKDKDEKDRLRRDHSKTLKWKEADNVELTRLEKSRDDFVSNALQHYLLSLRACDNHDSNVLRIFALWLEFYDNQKAAHTMKEYLDKVPGGKFALLMNQLSSRLQSEDGDSQRLLSNLVFRICVDHPYHGMHQMYALGATSDSRDMAAESRIKAARAIISKISGHTRAKHHWKAIHDSNALYHDLSMVKDELKNLTKEVTMEQLQAGRRVMKKIGPELKVPPATYPVEVRSSRNYDDLPVITGWASKVSIAGGLSAPKIATARASDGKWYKQLFKSGNDDLRQDAIMEQVFEQASKLLRNHAATRSRNLHIRNYKVVPLSGKTGLMEFVSNTIPFGEVLKPAHRKYYPKDWKEEDCRHKVSAAAQAKSSNEQRIKVYKEVAEHFHPVLRFFFLERFEDPDEWFEKRLAYTRTTAAISMLGHVLGLGDRHLHNILLDEKTGEVVHIDLGVAFDAGRILPCPEVVPFRLTRDVVDGMGYTKTEGVFRRCCEFTLDALRKEKEGIMILLNVLRYDPLVNWTVSAGKAKRMQDQAAEIDTGENKKKAKAEDKDQEMDDVYQSIRSKDGNAGEAGRALAVVEQKLGANQSVAAIVNGLIRQASDERNLALLFNGWAAYC